MTIDFFETEERPVVNFEAKYFISVYKTFFNNCTNVLCVAFLLEEEGTQENRFLVKEMYTVGTEKYKKFIDRIYGDADCGFVCVNTDDFDRFWGKCKISSYNDQITIDWSSLMTDSTPLSEFWRVYHPEAELELY